jgi:hypothetical protein
MIGLRITRFARDPGGGRLNPSGKTWQLRCLLFIFPLFTEASFVQGKNKKTRKFCGFCLMGCGERGILPYFYIIVFQLLINNDFSTSCPE